MCMREREKDRVCGCISMGEYELAYEFDKLFDERGVYDVFKR